MWDMKKALAGLGAQTRKPPLLRAAPGIADVERMLDGPGGAWAAAFEKRCNEVSLALFGITFATTNPKEPHPSDIKDESPASRFYMSDAARLAYGAALERWHDWRIVIAEFERAMEEQGAVNYFARLGYDVRGTDGDALRCLPHFARQLYVAHMGLLPGAKVTLDGRGKRAPQSVEDWGAALAAEAARFRPSR